MNGTLLHVAAAPFEAAVSVPVLPQGHRSRRLHGHSFLAAVRSRDGVALGERLREALAPLDYGYLNERITVPTDENIARWIRAALAEPMSSTYACVDNINVTIGDSVAILGAEAAPDFEGEHRPGGLFARICKIVVHEFDRSEAWDHRLEIRQGVEGMIHISEVSSDKIESLTEVLSVGQEVEAMVLRISPENKKIGLSIKAMEESREKKPAAVPDKGSEKVGTNLGDLLKELQDSKTKS